MLITMIIVYFLLLKEIQEQNRSGWVLKQQKEGYQMNTSMLSNKIQISFSPRKPLEIWKKHERFYERYSTVIFKTLRRNSFQSFINWMLKKESIDVESVENIRIMVFPFRKENGKFLAGKYGKGEIYIYPKRLEYYRKLVKRHGKKDVHSYLKNRARATLIHEFLHVKYLNNEEKVRQLTKKYLEIFLKSANMRIGVTF